MKSAAAAPPRILAKLRTICGALPEVAEEQAWVGTRWTVLTFRTAGLLHDTLRTAGAPFFDCQWGTRWGAPVIGMRLGPRPDWDQVAMLVTESYRLLAPKHLAAAVAPA